MSKTLEVYYSNRCEACPPWLAFIRSRAPSRGYKVREIDVDRCPTEECSKIRETPTVKVAGRKVNLERIRRMLE